MICWGPEAEASVVKMMMIDHRISSIEQSVTFTPEFHTIVLIHN
jgi:hypothetical protein